MIRALSLSIVLHALLIFGVLYSTKLSLALLKARDRDINALGTMQVDLTYKATDTAMKYGKNERDLPAPNVAEKSAPVEEKAFPEKSQAKKPEKAKKETGKQKEQNRKADIKSILDRLKQESKSEDNRPKPKEDNFPRSLKGDKGATGTGGRAQRNMSAAEMALQSAMRRYFELTDANNFRRKNPNAKGYIQIKLVGVGHQFEIAGLQVYQTTGFSNLDRSCEVAIRKALDSEVFGRDVIVELNGKEAFVVCEP